MEQKGCVELNSEIKKAKLDLCRTSSQDTRSIKKLLNNWYVSKNTPHKRSLQ